MLSILLPGTQDLLAESPVCSLTFGWVLSTTAKDLDDGMMMYKTVLTGNLYPLFLVACTRLYNPLCLSVSWSVGPSVCW